jgi:hypothetical protein
MADLAEHGTRITRLEIWKNGNGSKGAEKRIQDLEERVKPDNCVGLAALNKHLKEIKEARERKRGFRIGDIANIIQFVLLLIVILQLFRG